VECQLTLSSGTFHTPPTETGEEEVDVDYEGEDSEEEEPELEGEEGELEVEEEEVRTAGSVFCVAFVATT